MEEKKEIFDESRFYLQKGGCDPEKYIDLINYTFGFNGFDRSFVKLLPKLFSKENRQRSTDQTFFAFERSSGEPVACVGAFPLDYSICGEKVSAVGIGNVAVHPRYRGLGLMKAAMHMALDEMTGSGAAMAVLSGRRHRYNHFGIEKCGTESVYTLTRKTISYLRPDLDPRIEMKLLEKSDEKALDEIYALHNTRDYRTERPRERLYDILTSWQTEPFVFYKDGAFAGWAILYGDNVSEIMPTEPAFAADMAVALSGLRYSLDYHIPQFQQDVGNVLWDYAENIFTGADLCFSVLDYAKLLGLLMKLKSKNLSLADGELKVSVDGYAKKEDLVISVEGGVPSVRPAGAGEDFRPEIALSHLEAMQLFFMGRAPSRERINPVARSWFPLCIYVHSPDNV